MQRIYYEKDIDLSHQLKELKSLTVDENIDYKIEENGMRAVGSLIMKGEYLSEESRLFVESVELDVFANKEKIIDRHDFCLKVEDFHYEIIEGNLKVTVEVGIYGVRDGNDRYIKDDDSLKEIEQLSRQIDQQQMIEKQESLEDMSLPEETVYEKKEKEEDVADEDVGIYYLYVVKNNDTYESIAEHYGVDVQHLKDYNDQVTLESGIIIIIPYESTNTTSK